MKFLYMILIVLCVSGCKFHNYMNGNLYSVGECYASDSWGNAFIIEEVLDHGVRATKIEREKVVYVRKAKDDEKSDVYLTFRLFKQMYYEQIDCILVEGK